MALRLTKTSKAVFALSIVVLSGALGYLIWRVNQQETVAPTRSDAGGGGGACCEEEVGCVAGYECKDIDCDAHENPSSSYYGEECPKDSGEYCRSFLECVDFTGAGDYWCEGNNLWTCIALEDEEPPTEGDCKDTTCEWPKVVMSQENCACAECGGAYANICTGDPPTCEPPACGTGLVSTGTSVSHDGGTKQTNKKCLVYHSDCNNPSYIYRYCAGGDEPPVEDDDDTNVCDGGSWITKPTGSYPLNTSVEYSLQAEDSDGIDKSSITAKLCNKATLLCLIGETLTPTITGTTSPITISGSLTSLAQGTYTISFSWKDALGASSLQCRLTSWFTVAAADTNPSWDITKGVVDVCIDENTTDPKAELTYTVTVKNTGDAAGSISKIEDVLDEKILAAGIVPTNITSPGTYSNGKIVWNFATPLSIAAGTTKTYTYKVVIDKEHFDTYANEVTLVPVGSDAIKATAIVPVDCEIGIVTSADWTIEKGVTEQCIDEETEDPKSALSYTVTVTNTGSATGGILQVEDVLDPKVLAAGFIPTNIISPGQYSNGKILWSFSPAFSIAVGASKVFTYSLVVDKDNFGVYQNEVTLTPETGATVKDTAQISADCIITEDEIPQTGIFDSTVGRITAGIVLLIVGAVVYNMPSRVFLIQKKEPKYTYRKKFEKRMAKR